MHRLASEDWSKCYIYMCVKCNSDCATEDLCLFLHVSNSRGPLPRLQFLSLTAESQIAEQERKEEGREAEETGPEFVEGEKKWEKWANK